MTQHIAVFDPAFPVARLRPGHQHPLFAANPRKSGHKISLPELQQSIRDQGVLQPLRAFPVEDGSGDYWVHVGERRLLASQMNLEAHPDARDTVPVFLIENLTPQEALHESLTEQLNRLPLHPIDQFEAFAELKNGGMDEATIAAHYGIDKRVVRQRIALGRAHPDILKAWRGGATDQETVQEFTRLIDKKDQLKLFERLRKSNQLYAAAVRAALVPDQGDGARFVEFVGLDAYRARGGEIREDLFHSVHAVSDTALAAVMVAERLEAEALRLTSLEGWSWAKPVEAMPAAWRHFERSAPKADLTVAEKKRLAEIAERLDNDELPDGEFDALQAEHTGITVAANMRAFSSRQKAKSGCVLYVTQEGRLGIEPGVILPPEVTEQTPPPAPAKVADEDETGEAEGPKEEPAPRISNLQASDLAVTLTEAAAMAVTGNFNLAMAAALAAFAVNSDGLPVRLRHAGMGSNALKLSGADGFAKNLSLFLKMKPQQREALFCQVIAASLKFDSFNAERHAMTDGDIAALVNAVDPKVMVPLIHKRFDAAAYFDRAPKGIALTAIGDVFGKNEKDFSEASSKADVAVYAATNCPPAKWLPPELRPTGYTGPGAKKPKAANPAKPTKAAAKKSATKKPAKGKR